MIVNNIKTELIIILTKVKLADDDDVSAVFVVVIPSAVIELSLETVVYVAIP